MKSYTDLEQSKKLAEFLPIESADMWYDNIIPCWSLAALLDTLPKNLNIGRPSLESNYEGYYWIQYYDEFMKPNNYKTECFNNPVDACYEIVIVLHEQKLL